MGVGVGVSVGVNVGVGVSVGVGVGIGVTVSMGVRVGRDEVRRGQSRQVEDMRGLSPCSMDSSAVKFS